MQLTDCEQGSPSVKNKLTPNHSISQKNDKTQNPANKKIMKPNNKNPGYAMPKTNNETPTAMNTAQKQNVLKSKNIF